MSSRRLDPPDGGDRVSFPVFVGPNSFQSVPNRTLFSTSPYFILRHLIPTGFFPFRPKTTEPKGPSHFRKKIHSNPFQTFCIEDETNKPL